MSPDNLPHNNECNSVITDNVLQMCINSITCRFFHINLLNLIPGNCIKHCLGERIIPKLNFTLYGNL